MHLQKYTDSSNWIGRYVLSKRYPANDEKESPGFKYTLWEVWRARKLPQSCQRLAESNSSFLKAPETSQVLHIWMNALLTYGTSFTNNFETASQHNCFNVVVSIIITFKKHSE